MNEKKELKERILNFIAYYKGLPNEGNLKGDLKLEIERICKFRGNTFYNRMTNEDYSEAEIIAIENLMEKHKKEYETA